MYSSDLVMAAVNHVNAGDTALVLVSAALVLLMTPGLAFFYGGLVHHRSVVTIILQSYISMGIVTLIWVACGFSLAYGQDHWGIIGDLGNVGLRGVGMAPSPLYAVTVPFLGFFLFQVMFAIITPALITGAFADRIGFRTYLIFLVLWSLLVYVPFVHWIWGHGFLAQMGVVDFAGGLVVHLSAGMAALASVFIVGSRSPGHPDSRLPHNLPFVALGTGLLWFGWFGFNGGSALAANGLAAIAFVNTNTAASMAMVTWMLIAWWHTGKPSLTGAMAGAVAGLATITPAAGFVPAWSALIIGLGAGAICYAAVQFREARKWDDALDVWAVHGVGGALGTILTGVFATVAVDKVHGLIDGGGAHQLGVQVVGVLVVAAYSFAATYVILRLIGLFMDVRVAEDIEVDGLDHALHGERAYQQFWPLPTGETGDVMPAGADPSGAK